MAVDYRVTVGVNVNDSALTSLETRLNSLQTKPHTISVGVNAGNINQQVGAVTKQVSKALSSSANKTPFNVFSNKDKISTAAALTNMMENAKSQAFRQPWRKDAFLSYAHQLQGELNKINATPNMQPDKGVIQTQARNATNVYTSAVDKFMQQYSKGKGNKSSKGSSVFDFLDQERMASQIAAQNRQMQNLGSSFGQQYMNAWNKAISSSNNANLNKAFGASVDTRGLQQSERAYTQHLNHLLGLQQKIRQAQLDIVNATQKRTKSSLTPQYGDTGMLDRALSQQIKDSKASLDRYSREYVDYYQKHAHNITQAQQQILNQAYKGTDFKNTGANKQIVAQTKALESSFKEIDRLFRSVESLKSNKTLNTSQIDNLQSQISSAVARRDGLLSSFKGNITGDSLGRIVGGITTSDNQLDYMNSKLADIRRNSNLRIVAKVNAGDTLNKLNAIQTRIDSIRSQNLLTSTSSAFTGLKSANADLQKAINSFNTTGLADTKGNGLDHYMNNFDKAYQRAQNAVAINERLEKQSKAQARFDSQKQNFLRSMDDWFRSNSKAQDTYLNRANDIKQSVQGITKASQQIDLNKAIGQFDALKREATASGQAAMKFSDRLKMQGTRLASYYMASFGMMQSMFLVMDAFRNVAEVDTAMTELRRVTDLSANQYADIYSNLTNSAKEYGATLKDTISSTADWVKQGFNVDDAQSLAEISSMYQHIGDIEKAEANENLITAFNGYKEELTNLFGGDEVAAVGYAGDVYNEIGNNFAITSGQIGDGMTRAASALSFAGNTFQEAAGMITGVTEVTQDPTKAGSAMKILSLRLRGMKGELEEVEAGASEGVESVSKMQTQILNMTGGKVNIFDDNREFKSTYEIMKGIAEVWDSLNDVDQANLLETIAGKNRANDVAALIDNWDRVEEATEAATNATGSASVEHEKYLDSIEGRMTKLQATWEALSNTMIGTGFIKSAVGGLTEVLSVIESIISSMGMIPVLIGGIAAAYGSSTLFKVQKNENGSKQLTTSFGSFQSIRDTISGKSGTIFDKNFSQQMKDNRTVMRLFGNELQRTGDRAVALKNTTDRLGIINASRSASGKSPIGFSESLKTQLSNGVITKWDVKDTGRMEAIMKNVNREESLNRVTTLASSNSFQDKAMVINTYNEALEKSKESQKAIATYQEKWAKTDPTKLTGSKLEQYNKDFAAYNKALAVGTKGHEDIAKAAQKADASMSFLSNNGDKKASMGGYIASKGMTAVKNFATSATSMLAGGIMGVGVMAAISGVMTLGDAIRKKVLPTAEELADKAEDVTSKYKEQKETIKEANSTIEESGARYAELSKGVDKYGKNVSLSASEYQEYISLSNQLAQSMPDLVQGYDAQGNAILKCRGNLEQLTAAYKDLINTANTEILGDAGDIFKNFESQFKDFENKDLFDSEDFTQDTYDAITELKKDNADIDKLLEEYSGTKVTTSNNARLKYQYGFAYSDRTAELAETLENNGAERDKGDWWNPFDNETDEEFVKRILKEDSKTMDAITTGRESLMKSAAEDMQLIAEAHFSDAFLSGDYDGISDDMQTMINNIVPNMSYDFFAGFVDENGKFDDVAFYEELNNILGFFNNLDDKSSFTFEAFMDIQTQYNNGEITAGEYEKKLQDVESFISVFDEHTQEALRMTLGIDVETGLENRDAFVAKLVEVEDEAGNKISQEAASTLADNLTSTELEAAINLVANGEVDKTMIDDYVAEVDKATKWADKALLDPFTSKFGNVDLGEGRGYLEWTQENLKKYDSAIESWGESFKEGDISTVLGGTWGFEDVQFAYTPMLKTDKGLEYLDKNTVTKYFNEIADLAKADDGKIDAGELLSFDMTGLEVSGKKISNLIAGVGANAEAISHLMHYAGTDGAIEMTDAMQAIRREAEILAALDYEIDMTAETESMDAFNTALSETISATGVTEESINALNNRYAGLEVTGRNLSDIFEATAVGLRINGDALNEFEQALSNQKLQETTGELEKLEKELTRVEGIISNPDSTSAMRNAAIARRDEVIAHMNLLGQQAAMYEGLTNKYAAWQNAEAAGQNRDMYESVITAHDTVKDELSRGWTDDGTVKYLELLTGRSDLASKSIQEMRSIFKGLDKDINSAGYSRNDFFTVDSEGNSTSEGFYNFLDTINARDSEVEKAVTKHKDGSYTFDFEVVGGDKAIADALDISEELVDIMLQAGKDAGFEVNFEGQYEHYSKIVSSAEKALATLEELDNKDYDFDFGSTDIESISTDLADAMVLIDKYRDGNTKHGMIRTNKNGEVVDANGNVLKGGKEALEVASTLQTAYDRLSDPIYMSIDSSSIGEELEEPLNQLQEYDRLLAERNQLELKGRQGTKAYKDNAAAMKETFEYFKKIRDENKTLAETLGIDDMSDTELQNALDNQTLNIPTEIEITANIDDSVSKMLDIAMVNAGLKDPVEIPWMLEERDDVNLGGVDLTKYGEDAQRVYEEVITPHKEFFNSLNDNGRSIAVDYYVENPEVIDAFETKEEKEIALRFVANNQELLDGLENDAQRKRVINFRVEHSEWLEKFTEVEDRDIIYNFIAKKKNMDWLEQFDKNKQKIALKFMADTDDTLSQYGDGKKKIILETVMNNPGVVKSITELSADNQKIVFDCMLSNPGFFTDITPENMSVIIDFLVNNPDFLTKYDDPVEQQIVLEYIAENGEEEWNKLGEKGQEEHIETQLQVDTSDITAIPEDVDNAVSDAVDEVGTVKAEVPVEGEADVKDGTIEVGDSFDVTDPPTFTTKVPVQGEPDVINGSLNVDGQIDVQNPPATIVEQTVDIKPVPGGIIGGLQTLWGKFKSMITGGAITAPATVSIAPQITTTNLGGAFSGNGTVDMTPQTTNMGNSFTGSGTVDMAPTKYNMGTGFTGSGTINLRANITGLPANATVAQPKVVEANGTANVSGTVHSGRAAFANGITGRAFANGNWGIKGSGVALAGELGPEVVVRNGRFFTVGDTGAEFFKYQPNDIVFNARQSQELFRYGGIKGAKPRGKMLAGGSAFAGGTAPFSGNAFVRGSIPSSGRAFPFDDDNKGGSNGGGSGRPTYGDSNPKTSSGVSGKSSTSKTSDTDKDTKKTKKTSDDFKEVFDWIEVAIDRIERLIDRLGKTADSVYKTWKQRSNAISKSITQTRKEIDLQWQGYNRYMKEANKVTISKDKKTDTKYKKLVQNGKIDIETIKNEKLAEKIQEYQEWYEKALDCKDAIDELGLSLAELYTQKFDLVVTKYESALTRLEHKSSMLEERISQSEAKGQVVNTSYYNSLIKNEQNEQAKLIKQRDEMKAAMNEAMNSGTLAKYSEEWYRQIEEINGVTLAIEESKTSVLEYQNSIREIEWEKFDLLQEKISDITTETEFLIDLMSNKELYNEDTGQLTDEGMATMGLHAENYNVHMKQAALYQEQIKKLNDQIAKDPKNQELIERRREMIEAQQDSIAAAEAEKDAIRDMVEEGINLELDALQERIDKYNEALESQKD